MESRNISTEKERDFGSHTSGLFRPGAGEAGSFSNPDCLFAGILISGLLRPRRFDADDTQFFRFEMLPSSESGVRGLGRS